MSFGFGIGDALAVASLAQQVYNQCKAAPSEFQAASAQANGVGIVLREIHDSWSDVPRTADQEQRLKLLCNNCSIILRDLNETLSKYNSLGTDAPGKRERFRWDAEKAQRARQQLDEQLTVLNAFKTSLISSSQGQILKSQAQIEQKLDDLLVDIQRGVKDSNAVTNALDYSKDERVRMNELAQTLKDYDISARELNENKQFIDAFLQSAYAQGRMEVKVEHTTRIAPGNPLRTQAPTQMVLPTAMPMRTHSRLIPLAFIPGTICFFRSWEKALNRADHEKLKKAIESNDIETARKRMQQGVSAPWLETQGFHGLHVVAKEGWVDMARLLVSSGLPVNVQTSDGKRPIHVACENGNTEIAEFFMQDDPTQVWTYDYHGATPLHAACSTAKGRSLRLVRRLVDRGAEIEAANDMNETALLALFRCVSTPDPDNFTESKRMWSQTDKDVVQYLLQKGANCNVRSDNGKDPWKYLSSLPDPEVSQMLSSFSRRR